MNISKETISLVNFLQDKIRNSQFNNSIIFSINDYLEIKKNVEYGADINYMFPNGVPLFFYIVENEEKQKSEISAVDIISKD